MKKHIQAILEYCEENEIEINFSPDGIGVWSASTQELALKNTDVKVEDVEKAVAAFSMVIKTGWTNS